MTGRAARVNTTRIPNPHISADRELTQISVPCVACGRPGAEHGEHEYRDPANVSQGKGMGGTHEHLERLALCRECHRAVHAKTITISIEGAMATVVDMDGAISERPLHPVAMAEVEASLFTELLDAMLTVDDESLAHVWAEADDVVHSMFMRQCAVAKTMHNRYGRYGDDWMGQAAALVRSVDGAACSPATMDARLAAANALLTQKSPEKFLHEVGLTVAVAVGRSGDPAQAAEYALEERAKGRQMTKIANEIAEKAEVLLECPDCKFRGTRQDFRRAKE